MDRKRQMDKATLNTEFASRLNEACDDDLVPTKARARLIAEWLGMDTKNPTTARNWLLGHTAPRQESVIVLAQKLHVSPAWLAYGTLPKHVAAGIQLPVKKLEAEPEQEILIMYKKASPAVRKIVKSILELKI